jgi:hypothetical protein
VISKPLVQVVTVIVVGVFAVGILASGGTAEAEWLKFYSVAVLLVMVVLGVWDRWLWKFCISQKIPSTPINLNGTWQGELISAWVDPETDAQIVPIPTYVVIRQTASRVKVTMLTRESRSSSTIALITQHEDRTALEYMYLNEPRSSVNHKSSIHYGSAALSVYGRPAKKLEGRYWADRNTRGELVLDTRNRSHAEDFDAAMTYFV